MTVGAAGSGSVTLASTSATLTAGYHYSTTDWNAAAALTPTNYSNIPTPGWVNAVQYNYGSPWHAENIGDYLGAFWINTIASASQVSEGPYPSNSWRLFKQDFTIPVNAYNIAGVLHISADNGAAAYIDNAANKIGQAGLVGPPDQVYDYIALGTDSLHGQQFDSNFTTTVGSHTLYVVSRNWGWNVDNPTGVIFKATINYDLAALSTLTPPTGFNLVGTTHTVQATLDYAVAGVPILFVVTGVNELQGWANTNASGVATFTYTGANSGVDTITASFNGVTKTATKTWCWGLVTGGGTIGKGKDSTWSLSGNVGKLEGSEIIGQIQIQNQKTGVKYHISDFSSIVFSGGNAESPVAHYDTVTFIGTAKDGPEIKVVIEDLGEPGAGVDTLAIDIGNNGFGPEDLTTIQISGGNYQVHDLEVHNLALSGTWVLHVNSSAYNHDMYIQIQDVGGALTGQGGYPVTVEWPYGYPYNWTMTGQLTGINVSMLITYENGYTAAITGTVASDGNSMSGGAGTGGVVNWTANRVP